MSERPINRWRGPDLWGDMDEYVTYEDHLAALRACEQRVRGEEDCMVPLIRRNEFERGVQAARDAVEALDPRYDGEWRIKYADALAAIDALRGSRG